MNEKFERLTFLCKTIRSYLILNAIFSANNWRVLDADDLLVSHRRSSQVNTNLSIISIASTDQKQISIYKFGKFMLFFLHS
jgi:hypothetical protein